MLTVSLTDWERQIRKITEAEQQHAKNARLTKLIKDTVSKYRHPLQQLNITYPLQSRTKTYSEDEDRFLVCALARHGIGSDDVYDTIKREILEWPGFRFDWFIKSRTPLEISRRCLTLISLVQKEHAPEDAAVDPARKGRGPRKVKEVNGEANGDTPEATNGSSRKRDADTASEAGSVAAPPAKVSLGESLRVLRYLVDHIKVQPPDWFEVSFSSVFVRNRSASPRSLLPPHASLPQPRLPGAGRRTVLQDGSACWICLSVSSR